MGGGIFAKTAKTPPLQSAMRVALRPNIAHFSPIAMRILCTPHAARLWGPYGFSNDAARCVATFFERWNCLIETSLRVRRENPPNWTPAGPFAAVPFGIRRFKTYSPISLRT